MCTSISTRSKGRRRRPRRLGLDRAGAVARLRHVQAPLLEHGHGDQHVDRVVLGDQHAPALQRRERIPAAGRWAARRRASGRSAQKALPYGRAVDADAAAHQRGQLAADRQAQAGAAVAARDRVVGLREGREQAAACRRRCPAGVAPPGEIAPSAHAGLDAHAAALGELDRVGDEVGEDLAHAQRSPRTAAGTSSATESTKARPWPRPARAAGGAPPPPCRAGRRRRLPA